MFYKEKKFSIPPDKMQIPIVLEQINEWLIAQNVPANEAMRACVKAEDVLVALISKADYGANVDIAVRKFFGSSSIHCSCAGGKISMKGIDASLVHGLQDDDEREVMEKFYQQAFNDHTVTIEYDSKKGINMCQIQVRHGHI